jgi:hypothetical protein
MTSVLGVCFMSKQKQFGTNNMGTKLEVCMLCLEKILQRLWKSILTSNLHQKDKAEILRLLIFAFTFIVITALFVLNRF